MRSFSAIEKQADRSRVRRAAAALVGCTAGLLITAPAHASTRHLQLDPGEVLLQYSGSADASSPTSFCSGTRATCGANTAFGRSAYGIAWSVAIAFTPSRRAAPRDAFSSLSATGDIDRNYTIGCTSPVDLGLCTGPAPCRAPLEAAEDRYLPIGRNRRVVLQRQPAGRIRVALEAPAGAPWLRARGVPPADLCGLADTDTSDVIIGQGSFGPSGAEEAKLERVLYPHLRAGPSTTTRRSFDFDWRGNRSHSTGPFAATVIKVRSQISVYRSCEIYNLDTERCVEDRNPGSEDARATGHHHRRP